MDVTSADDQGPAGQGIDEDPADRLSDQDAAEPQAGRNRRLLGSLGLPIGRASPGREQTRLVVAPPPERQSLRGESLSERQSLRGESLSEHRSLRDLLPATLRGRWRIDRRGALALGALALLGVLIAGWQLWRAQPHVTTLPSGSDAASQGPYSGVSPGGTRRGFGAGDPGLSPVDGLAAPKDAAPGGDVPGGGAPGGEVEVDVVGKVARPGVVRLPPGARIIDAINAAGGSLPGADLTSLDLAQRLTDGEQLRVGIPGSAPQQSAPSPQAPAVGSGRGKAALPPGTTISLNNATAAQLQQLPGIGPAMATRIIAWRDQHGGFASVQQLQQIPGIGPHKFAALQGLVTL